MAESSVFATVVLLLLLPASLGLTGEQVVSNQLPVPGSVRAVEEGQVCLLFHLIVCSPGR